MGKVLLGCVAGLVIGAVIGSYFPLIVSPSTDNSMLLQDNYLRSLTAITLIRHIGMIVGAGCGSVVGAIAGAAQLLQKAQSADKEGGLKKTSIGSE